MREREILIINDRKNRKDLLREVATIGAYLLTLFEFKNTFLKSFGLHLRRKTDSSLPVQ